jgi:hypothetical protein
MGTHMEVVVPSMSRTTAPMSEGELISFAGLAMAGERNEREKSEKKKKKQRKSRIFENHKTREALHLCKRTFAR